MEKVMLKVEKENKIISKIKEGFVLVDNFVVFLK